MESFVTGGTGFIGRFLVERLLARGETVHLLVREGSEEKLAALRSRAGAAGKRIVSVSGDITKPGLGLSAADLKRLRGRIRHFFHLAAIYELGADPERQQQANVEGTRHAVEAAAALGAKCFHHVSSIAAAGLYEGTFTEDMFEEAYGLDHPYFRTKHDAEAVVRGECAIPWRIYRPAIVVGDSRSGEMDKVDGPYYLFKLIQRMRESLPSWLPAIGLEGGRLNLVPVDYVAAAIDHIAHRPRLDRRCFHLVDPQPLRVGEILDLFTAAAGAPRPAFRVNPRMLEGISPQGVAAMMGLSPVRNVTQQLLDQWGIPRELFRFVNYPTRFDATRAQAALEGSGITVPPLADYAPQLWNYWEAHLDPDLNVDRTLAGRVRGKVVVLTGGTSGIGEATAYKLAEAGAILVIAARDADKAAPVMKRLKKMRAQARFVACDLASLEDCDRLVATVLREHGHCDVLVNNAGRSIRRAIAASYDRFHDFERTMQLNYFGSLRLIMGFLPSMSARRAGHIVNISSIGVLTRAPRFSAYVASKAALDAFSDCAASEFAGDDIRFTTVNMPLVRTPMIAPTKLYEHVPTLTPEQAADLVAEAIADRPVRIATRLGVLGEVLHAVAPKVTQLILNTAFRMFPDSTAAQKGGRRKGDARGLSPEQVAFAAITKGIHW